MIADTQLLPIHALWMGPFGGSVVSHLQSLCPDVIPREVVHNETDDCGTAARADILVTSRPARMLCMQINETSHRLRRPFLSVVQDSTALRVGPLTLPGKGACWKCWDTRERQHSRWTRGKDSLTNYYSTEPNAGPRGYLEPIARMAAVRVAQIISTLDAGTAAAGYVWEMDIFTLETTEAFVVGVHDCPFCGLNRPRTSRHTDEMEKLCHLWREN
jgi:bacteriocin biosynthesis cyclodehydratase domain-containing protein